MIDASRGRAASLWVGAYVKSLSVDSLTIAEFIVKACLAARDAKAEDPLSRIHESWLMTPRDDLHSQSPRDVLLATLDFIDFDLHTRQWQSSMLGEGPPPLARDSFAYLFAGFGTHEVG